MPKIFEYLGFIFLFYSNDHKPLHSILSPKNRTKKRKNNQKNQGEMKIIQVENARYIDGYKVEIGFSDKVQKLLIFGLFLLNTLIRNMINIKILAFSDNLKLRLVISFGVKTGI